MKYLLRSLIDQTSNFVFAKVVKKFEDAKSKSIFEPQSNKNRVQSVF